MDKETDIYTEIDCKKRSRDDQAGARSVNEKKQRRSVQDFRFYEMRWIWKFSFKHCLMNEIETLKILLKST